jgi:hypothetical protein
MDQIDQQSKEIRQILVNQTVGQELAVFNYKPLSTLFLWLF